jgi:hypothetical protein
MKYVIREDHIENLRLVAEKLKGIHDGCSVIITSVCDSAERNSISDSD